MTGDLVAKEAVLPESMHIGKLRERNGVYPKEMYLLRANLMARIRLCGMLTLQGGYGHRIQTSAHSDP